jgi:hypothetical protein
MEGARGGGELACATREWRATPSTQKIGWPQSPRIRRGKAIHRGQDPPARSDFPACKERLPRLQGAHRQTHKNPDSIPKPQGYFTPDNATGNYRL